MPEKIASAAAAYANTLAKNAQGGMEPRGQTGESFSEMLKTVADDAVKAGTKSEAMSLQAVQGKADLTEVITALTAAEVTLQTVTAVRDKVVEAYQDIMRMPI